MPSISHSETASITHQDSHAIQVRGGRGGGRGGVGDLVGGGLGDEDGFRRHSQGSGGHLTTPQLIMQSTLTNHCCMLFLFCILAVIFMLIIQRKHLSLRCRPRVTDDVFLASVILIWICIYLSNFFFFNWTDSKNYERT